MFRRQRQQQPPQRRPHPDPRVEVRLQQVISLRRAAARNEEMLDECQRNISETNSWLTAHPGRDSFKRHQVQLRSLQEEMGRLNAATGELHEQLGKLLDQFNDDQLLWLEAADAR